MGHAHQQDTRRKGADVSREAPPAGGATEVPLELQRAAGNRAVAELIAGAQAKLKVGQVDDPLEREADAVAGRVVRAIRNGGASAAPVVDQVQRRPSPGGGPGGGPVSEGTERAIEAKRGGGRPLPDDTRAAAESAFGADFGHVRVHTGGDATKLTEQIGAQAFTVGSDIFFGEGGLPGAKDPLLHHELTHVVQQGAGGGDTAQRSPVIQRRASGRPLTALQAHKGTKDGAVDDEGRAVDIPAGTQLTVNEQENRRRRGKGDDPEEPAGWVQVTDSEGPGSKPGAFRRLWVRVDALDLAPAQDEDDDDDGSVGGEVVEDLELGKSLFEGFQGLNDEKVAKAGGFDKTTESNIGIASDAGDIAGTFISFASMIRAFSSDDVKGADKAEAALKAYASGLSGAKGVASIVKTANNAGKDSTEAGVAGGLGGFADIFGGIKETYNAIRKIVELVQSANDKAKAKDGQEVFKDIMATAASLMEAAKSGVSAAKNFLDTFGTGASDALSNTIPGFGIALGAADLIVRSVDLVSAMIHSATMRKEKQSFKEMIGGKKGKSSEKEAKQIIADLDAKKERGEDLTDEEQARYAAANEYLFSKGMQWINDKRRNRAILKMSVAMTKAAGDVATLGGASAPVGVGLKAGALALDVGASVFRKLKQWGRDKKAAKEAKGEEVTGFFSIFNSDKSTAKKEVGYHKMVDKIFDMILTADAQKKPEAPKPDTRFDKVNKYIAAMGMSIKKLVALQSQPAKLRAEMITALKKRE